MSFTIKAEGQEEGQIVLLHGYGADAENMRFLANEWQPYFKNWAFTSLDAPIPLQPEGFAWFDLQSVGVIQEVKLGANQVRKQLEGYNKKLIVAGFSQGAFIANQLAIDMEIIGCISFSGAILPAQPRYSSPILLIHGTEDKIIEPCWFEQSMLIAKDNGLDVEGTLIEGMKHEINDEALAIATLKLSKWIYEISIIN